MKWYVMLEWVCASISLLFLLILHYRDILVIFEVICGSLPIIMLIYVLLYTISDDYEAFPPYIKDMFKKNKR